MSHGDSNEFVTGYKLLTTVAVIAALLPVSCPACLYNHRIVGTLRHEVALSPGRASLLRRWRVELWGRHRRLQHLQHDWQRRWALFQSTSLVESGRGLVVKVLGLGL